jgi:hypothetical protein
MQRMRDDQRNKAMGRSGENVRKWSAESTMPEVQTQAVSKANAVSGILVEWADWSKGYRMRIGYPSKSAGFEPGGGVVTRETSEHQYDDVAADRCRIVDRCIDDLPVKAQSAAIHRCYLSAVYRLRDYEQTLRDAHEALETAFRRKGVLWG